MDSSKASGPEDRIRRGQSPYEIEAPHPYRVLPRNCIKTDFETGTSFAYLSLMIFRLSAVSFLGAMLFVSACGDSPSSYFASSFDATNLNGECNLDADCTVVSIDHCNKKYAAILAINDPEYRQSFSDYISSRGDALNCTQEWSDTYDIRNYTAECKLEPVGTTKICVATYRAPPTP